MKNKMYQITDIQIKKNNKNKVEIFVNGEFFIETYFSIINNLDLYIGKMLTKQMLEALKRNDELTSAKNDAIRFLSYRPRSVWEIKKKLKDKKYLHHVIQDVINWLTQEGFIDDRDFALRWIKSQVIKKPAGRIKLKNELYGKGIPKEIADSVIESFFEQEDELKLAYLLIKKKDISLKLKNTKLDPKKIGNLLKSQGFSNPVIQKIFEDFPINEDRSDSYSDRVDF